MLLNLIVYVVDALIIGAYLAMTRNPRMTWWFHLANAVGGIPLLISEVVVGAWAVMPITVFFTAIGWYGLAKDWYSKPMYVRSPESTAGF